MASNRFGKSIDRSTNWSDWVLDPRNNRYYHERLDATGRLEREYDNQQSPSSQQATPRNQYSNTPQSLDRFGSSPQEYPPANPAEYSTSTLATRHASSPRQSRSNISSFAAMNLSPEFPTLEMAHRPTVGNTQNRGYSTSMNPAPSGSAEGFDHVPIARETYDNRGQWKDGFDTRNRESLLWDRA